MALLLDDKLVGEVAERCPVEFLKYYECLGGGDAQLCLSEQKTLSACVTQKSPVFKQIVSKCQKQISEYEKCISQNEFKTQCFDNLLATKDCVDKIISK